MMLSIRPFFVGNWDGWHEAAEYLLEHHLNLDEALADVEGSIRVEERFENLFLKSQILEALNQKEEAKAVREAAYRKGGARQMNGYGLYLLNSGKRDLAFDVYRANLRLHRDEWVAHIGGARLACAEKDFDAAFREIQEALAGPPDRPGRTWSDCKRD